VRWDDGTYSKHYSKGLQSVGRFNSPEEFRAALHTVGQVIVRTGPRGGVEYVEATVEYNGQMVDVRVYDRDFWNLALKPVAAASGSHILEERVA
jgi:hypothetical protein